MESILEQILTRRQILCFGAGALVSVQLFFVLKSTGNISFAAMGIIIVMMPMFFFKGVKYRPCYILCVECY